MKPIVLIAGLVALTLPLAAQAQNSESRENRAVVVDQLLACRSVADADERLACFDRTAAELTAATESKDVVVLDREGMRRAKRGLFGFSLPKIKLFGDGAGDEPELTQIDSTIAAAQRMRSGLWTFQLKDGTVWQTTDEQMGFRPAVGDAVVVKAGILGSYTAKVEGSRSTKVKRVR